MIIAHFCADILIYSPKLSGQKRKDELLQKLQALGIHCAIHGAWVWILLWPMDYWIRIRATLYIFMVHFVIDYTRLYIEQIFINKDEFTIFKRKDFFLWLRGKPNKQMNQFMKKYFPKWLALNILDQSLHMASILLFVVIFV